MAKKSEIKFKIATEKWEYDAIHKLNYQTFVDELPQHKPNCRKKLIDKFNKENTYFISIKDNKVIGMISVRDRRPFSLDKKLDCLDSYFPNFNSTCEIRLLSIDRSERKKRILQGLFLHLAEYCETKNFDIALISASLNNLKLYRNLGFKSFGPVVGSDEARFQPMYLTLDAYIKFKQKSNVLKPMKIEIDNKKKIINLLPGPVRLDRDVQSAFKKQPISHRSENFKKILEDTKNLLSNITKSARVEIITGSGSLANDIIAAQLSTLDGKGLVLSNGEFGERLIDHSERFRLEFETVKSDWGDRFDYGLIESCLIKKQFEWLWAVHCETSTGGLNNLDILKELSKLTKGKKLCIDAISSIGTIPLDLNEVYLASGVSGKGLLSYSGLCFVFYNHLIKPKPYKLPRYIDLGFFAENDGIPFTLSSNLLEALNISLKKIDVNKSYSSISELSLWLRKELNDIGLNLVSNQENCSPALQTISLPYSIKSTFVGKKLEEYGFLLGYKSKYLVRNNWVQISLMSNPVKEDLKPLIGQLKELSQSRSVAI